MNKVFLIETEQVLIQRTVYQVEAESEKIAKKKVIDGESESYVEDKWTTEMEEYVPKIVHVQTLKGPLNEVIGE